MKGSVSKYKSKNQIAYDNAIIATNIKPLAII